MKKRQLLKKQALSLEKETMVELDEEQMDHIPGGQDPTIMSSCNMFSCSPDNCSPEEVNLPGN